VVKKWRGIRAERLGLRNVRKKEKICGEFEWGKEPASKIEKRGKKKQQKTLENSKS